MPAHYLKDLQLTTLDLTPSLAYCSALELGMELMVARAYVLYLADGVSPASWSLSAVG